MKEYDLLITELRSAMNVSQEELAKLLGVSSITVSRWENGHSKPKKIIQIKINKMLDRYDIKMEENNNDRY